MATKTVTKDTFQSEVLNASKPVVVDFWAEWCGPCKMIAPSLEEISEEKDDIEVVKVDIDANQELAVQYGIRSIPTLMIFKDGEHKDTLMGAQSKSKLASWIDGAK